MTKMTVTRALVELKRLDSQIELATNTGVFAAATVGKNDFTKVLNSHKTKAEIRSVINGSFQKVEDLIAHRTKLKNAIVASNAVTQVTLGEKRMTVAQAIDLKATLPARQNLASAVKSQLAKTKAAVDMGNTKMEAEIQAQTTALLGADKSKQDAATLQMIAETQKSQKELAVVDEDFVRAKLEEIEADILNIKTELDFVLSESNALTQIEVA